MTGWRRLFIMVVAVELLACGAVSAYQIRGFVIGNGGMSANPASNGIYKLFGSVGLPCIEQSQNTNSGACVGFWCFGGPQVLAVGPSGGPSPPIEFALSRAFPNPTHDQVRFDLALPKAALVTLRVYDVAGREIGGGVSRQLGAGSHQLLWRAPSARAGMYFMRIFTDGVLRAKRTFIVLR